MSQFLDQLYRLAESLQIHSAEGFTLHGHRYESAERMGKTVADSGLSEAARSQLEDVLYSRLHCRTALDGSPADGFTDWVGARDFARRLSEANCGTGPWQPGWVVRGVETDGRIVAERHGVQFWMPPARFRHSGHAPGLGGSGYVKVQKEYREWIPGFYMALGDADDVCDFEDLVRLYWNIRSPGAAPLTAHITGLLNQAGLPFQFKLLNDPLRYRRADAAVLYVPRAFYERTAPLVAEIHGQVRTFLREAVSAYAKRLAPGLGIAEDPGGGSSFGQHRSQLLANAFASATCVAAGSAAARCDIVVDQLRLAGLDPNALHLGAGSTYDYLPIDDADPSSP